MKREGNARIDQNLHFVTYKRIIPFIVLPLLSLTNPAHGAEPAEVLSAISAQVIRILEDSSKEDAVEEAAQEEKLWRVLEPAFDFAYFSRLAMGSYWKGLSEQQKTAFVEAFKEFLRNKYIPLAFERYNGQKIIILGQELIGGNKAVVETKVIWRNLVIPVAFRMRQSQETTWKVYDIVILGISAARNYRSQFKVALMRMTPEQLTEKLIEKAG
jgi:phospholipid transport system substrate-binding protein